MNRKKLRNINSFKIACISFIVIFFSVTSLFAANSPIELLKQETALGFDRLWVLFAAALVFFMQAGFLFFEIGCVREKNVVATAMKNVIDWSVVSLGFFFIGFTFMFGRSFGGLIGTDAFLTSGLGQEGAHPLGYIFFMFQLAFAGTAATIVSGAMAGRTKFISYLIASLFIGTIIYPVFGHWAWGNLFFESNEPWLAKMGFMDFAGSTVVHSVGAWVALIGIRMVGPRIGRYNAEGKLQPLKSFNLAFGAIGVLILWLGWWGFNGGSTLAFNDEVGLIILNTNLAASAAFGSAFLHCFFFQNKEDIYQKILGGALGGLVAITAGCNVVSPIGAVLVGVTAGFIHNITYDLVLKTWKIDDVVGAIPVHGFCGVWGTLCVGLFGQADLLAHDRITQIGVQLIGITACFAWVSISVFLVFKALKMTFGLRVPPNIEVEGLCISREFEEEPVGDIGLGKAEIEKLLKGEI